MPFDEEDYIACESEKHAISDCQVAKRVMSVLQYFEDSKRKRSSASAGTVPLYEFICSLDGYDIPTFLEDWHHLKKSHLDHDEGAIEWMARAVKRHCGNGKRCHSTQRHGRDREREEFEATDAEIDIKNVILADTLDTIHTFVFHAGQRRRDFIQFRDIGDVEDASEQKYEDEKEEEKADTFADKNDEKVEETMNISTFPKSRNQWSHQQLVFFLQQHVLTSLPALHKQKIQDHEKGVVEFFKINKIDGNTFKQMKRKQFLLPLSDHLGNQKLKGALGAIYKAILEADLTSYVCVFSFLCPVLSG